MPEYIITMTYIIVGLLLVLIALLIAVLVKLSSKKEDAAVKEQMDKLGRDLRDEVRQSRKESNEATQQAVQNMSQVLLTAQTSANTAINENLESIRRAMVTQLSGIREENNRQLEQILSPEQYEANVKTRPNSTHFVEYAVKLPGADEGTVWLPIDAKFPIDAYTQLLEAYDSGDADGIKAAGTLLEQRIKAFARDIRDKYVAPPHTTDFGIMFLPIEGLYAEVVRRGLIETLQKDYHVNIAGPTTMAALLNSLQMGFRTLAIQKRSGEVWKLLGAVKTEFDKFGTVIEAAQQRLEQAGNELDKLVGVRTRQIQRRLAQVTSLPEAESTALLDSGESGE